MAVFCENSVKNTSGIFRRRDHVPMKPLAGKPTQVASELKTAHGFLPLSVLKELGILYKILYKPWAHRKAVKACLHNQEWISRNIVLFPLFAPIFSPSLWIMPEMFVIYPLHPQNTPLLFFLSFFSFFLFPPSDRVSNEGHWICILGGKNEGV